MRSNLLHESTANEESHTRLVGSIVVMVTEISWHKSFDIYEI